MRYVIGLVIIALLAWWGFGKFYGSNNAPVAAPSVKVSAAQAVQKDVPISLALVGNVIAYETVIIKSRIDSQIVEVKFHDGDFVKKGQVLFVLDDRTLKAQVAQEQAKATDTKLQYERARKLVAGKFVAQAQVDDARAAYETELANLKNNQVLLQFATITAPISGRAGTINITQGNNVKTNDVALVTINQVSPIRGEFHIPERYYEQVRAGKDIVVTATSRDVAGDTKGKLEYIDNQIDQNTGSFTARAVFPNEKEALWPGMFANLSMDLGTEKSALTIPAVAILGDEGKHFVFKIVDNKAVKTSVDVRIIGDDALISKGLADGDTVITDGLLRVTDGATIETTAK